MNTKGISIVVPCYNAGKFLRECVDSILLQPFVYPFEVVIVDDASDDAETISELESLNSIDNVNVVRLQNNHGVQNARSIGVKRSSFDYIFTIDADDKLNTNRQVLKNGTYADQAIDILDSNPEIAYVHGLWFMFGDFEGFTISAYPVTEKLVMNKHHVQTSIVYRKEDALVAGLYNENIKKWQDWSFGVGLLNGRYKSQKKNEIAFLDQPYYLYRIHKSNSRISLGQVSEKEMVRVTVNNYPEIFRKYYPSILDLDTIAEHVLKNKPNKLMDLLYIASFDLSRAIMMAKQRDADLKCLGEPPGIP